MTCQKFCCFRKARLTEDSKCLAFALEVFLASHRLLKNFMDFFKFHAGKCCGINYDEVPLHGALNVVAMEMAANTCGNMLKKESQRSESFRTCLCLGCQDTHGLSEDVVRRMEALLTCMRRACGIENIIRQIKGLLSTLGAASPCQMPDKHRMLFLLLRELMEKLIFSGHSSGEPLDNAQTRLMLNLVNNFIRDWSVKMSPTSPSLKICRFCERTISDTTRQWATFCCNDAQLFNSVRREWALRHSISDTRGDECSYLAERWKSPKSERGGDAERRFRTRASDEKLQTVCVKDYEAGYTGFDRSVRGRSARGLGAAGGSPTKPGFEGQDDWDGERDEFDRVKGRGGRVAADRRDEFDRVKGRGGRMAADRRDEFDRVKGRGGRMAADRRLDRETGEGLKRGRNIENGEDYPITPDRQKKRDDFRYKGKLDKIRGSRGLRGTAEDGTAVGKMGKIKSGKRSERSERAELLGIESEGKKAARSKTPRKSASEATERSRAKEGRRKKLYRNESSYDTDDEEGTADGQRRRKKTSKGRDDELDGAGDTSAGRRKKKADAIDSERNGTFYGTDEEGKARKRGGKRKGRASDEGEDTDSDLAEKRADAKGTSSGSRFSLDAEGRRKKYRTDVAYGMAAGDQSSIEYQLSNQHYVRLGWTVLPVAKTMREVIQYQAIPAKPHLDWFRKHQLNGRIYYDNTKTNTFINFLLDGSAQVFYPNGVVAIKMQKPQNRKYDMYTVFSPGGKDCMGVERKSQIVGVFDTRGNGVVFDEDGATRLSYNQIGGIWRDNPTGVPVTWKWNRDEKESITKSEFVEKSVKHLEKFLMSPKRGALNSVYNSASGKVSTSPSSSRKEKKVTEQKPIVAEPEKEDEVGSELDDHAIVSKDIYHFRTICFKLNDYIGLKILNRRNITLRFLAKGKFIRMELGTILNLKKEVASYFVDTSIKYGMLTCKFEEALPCHLTQDSSMCDIAQELETIRKSGRERNFMMAKYRPYLRAWKESGTRCRPR